MRFDSPKAKRKTKDRQSNQTFRLVPGGLGATGFLLLVNDASYSDFSYHGISDKGLSQTVLRPNADTWVGRYTILADSYLSYASFNSSISLGSHDDGRFYDAVVDASGGFASSHYQSLKTGGSSLFGGGIQTVSTEQPELGVTINDLAGECADNLGEEGKSAEQSPECKDEDQAFPVHSNLAVVDAPITLDAFQAVAYSSAGSGYSDLALSFVTGAVIDGYIEGAQVFLDINNNMVWDDFEPVAFTAADGSYSFETFENPASYSVVALGGTDVTTGAAIDVLIAPVGVTYVSPVSTLVEYGKRAGNDNILADLGFTEADLNKDPVATNDVSFLKTGASILTAAKVGATLVSNLDGTLETNDGIAQMFTKIAEVAKTSSIAGFKGNGSVESLLTDAIDLLAADRPAVDPQQAKLASIEVGKMIQSVVSKIATSASLNTAVDAAREGQVGLADKVASTVSSGGDFTGQADAYAARVDDYIAVQKLKFDNPSSIDTIKDDVITIDPTNGYYFKQVGSTNDFYWSFADPALNDGEEVSFIPGTLEPISESLAVNYAAMGISWNNDFRLDFNDSYTLNLDTSSYGDFFFKYSVEAEDGSTGTGYLTANIVRSFNAEGITPGDEDFPEPAASSGQLWNEVALSQLLDLDNTYGEGMRLSIFYSAEDLDSNNIKLQITDPLGVNPPEILPISSVVGLEIRDDQLSADAFANTKLLIDPNYAGEIDFKFLVQSQYGAAQYKDAPIDVTLNVKPVADGIVYPVELSKLITEAVNSETGLQERDLPLFSFSNSELTQALFGEDGDQRNELYFVDADDSEGIVLLLGIGVNEGDSLTIPDELASLEALPDTVTEFVTEIDNPNDAYHWYLINETLLSDTGKTIEQLLESIVLTPADGFSGELGIQLAYKIGSHDTVSSDEGLITGEDYAFNRLFVREQSLSIEPLTSFLSSEAFTDYANHLRDSFLPSAKRLIEGADAETFIANTTFPADPTLDYASESLAVLFGVSTSGVVIEHDAIKEVSEAVVDHLGLTGSYTWYLAPLSSMTVEELLSDITLDVNGYSGPFSIRAALGTMDTSTGDQDWYNTSGLSLNVGSEFILQSQGYVLPQLYYSSTDLTLSESDPDYDEDANQYVINPLNWVSLTAGSYKNEVFEFAFEVPTGVQVIIPEAENDFSWSNVPSDTAGISKYALINQSGTSVYLKDLFSDGAALDVPISIRVPDVVALPEGLPISVQSGVYLQGESELYVPVLTPGQDPQVSLSGLIKSEPDLSPGVIFAKSDAFEFLETQGDQFTGKTLNDLLKVNLNTAFINDPDNTFSLVLSFSPIDALKANPSSFNDELIDSYLSCKVVDASARLIWSYDDVADKILATLDFDGLSSVKAYLSDVSIGGKAFDNTGLEFDAYLKLDNALWGVTSYSPKKADDSVNPIVFNDTNIEITPVASGLDVANITGFELSPVTLSEGATVNLTDLINAANYTLKDASESLSFILDLPTNVKLQFKESGSWKDAVPRLVEVSGSDFKRFIVDEDVLSSDGYQVVLSANFSNTDATETNQGLFDYYITPIAVEEGSRTAGSSEDGGFEQFAGSLNITPVADGVTKLIVPQGDWAGNVSGGASYDIPFYAGKIDSSETLQVKLSIAPPTGMTADALKTTLVVTCGSASFVDEPKVVNGSVEFLATFATGANHSWSITSDQSFRGDQALTVTVQARTIDGETSSSFDNEWDSGTQSASLTPSEHTLELYQNIDTPKLVLTKTNEVVEGVGVPTFDFGINSQGSASWAEASNYSVLLTGVGANTYFVDSEDVAVGANLGSGLWLLRGGDYLSAYTGSADLDFSGVVKVIGQADLSAISAVVLASDSVTGSSATSGSVKQLPTTVNDPVDPVVMVFGNDDTNSVTDALVADRAAVDDTFTFDGQSLSLTAWMPGAITDGVASGGAFIVKDGYSGTLTLDDLFEDIDSLDAYIDSKGEYLADRKLTLNEMAEAGLSLWFDSSNYGTLDEPELYSIPEFLDDTPYTGDEEFDFNSRMADSPTVETLSDAADRLSLDEAISINESIYDTETQLGLAALDVQPSAVKAPVISVSSSNASNGTLTLTEDVPFDLSFNVTIDETVFADWGDVDKIVMAKIYGLPEAEDSGVITPDAMVTGGVFVDPGDGSGAFWLVTLEPYATDNATAVSYSIDASISFNQEHLVDPGTLSFQPLLSYTAPSHGVFGTFGSRLGAPTDIDYQITPVADTPDFIEPAVMEVGIASGETFALSELGLTITGPDSNESLSVQLTIDNQAFASNVKLRAIQDQTLSSSLSETSIYTIPVEDLSKIELSVPKEFKDSFSISLKGISKHAGDSAESSLSYDVNFEVSPVALGVSDHVITVTDSAGNAVEANFSADEGAMLYLQSTVTLEDAQENAIHKIYIDVTNGDVADAIVSFGEKAIETILHDDDGSYFEFEQSEIDALSNNVIAIETTPAFDGEISFTPAAYSIEPASANKSDSFLGTDVSVEVSPTAGEFNDGVQSYVIRLEQEGDEVTQLMLQEGQSAQFDLVVTNFDAGESVDLGVLPTGVTSVTISDEERAELADPENATRFRFEIDNQSADMLNGVPQLQQIPLPLALTEASDTHAIDVPLSFTVMPGAETPTFNVTNVRAEFDLDLGEVDLSEILPKITSNSSDDVITYKLDLTNIPADAEPFIKTGTASLGSASSYSFQPSVLSSISLATLGAVFAQKVAAAIELDWSAMAVDPYSGSQANSSSVGVYLTPKIELSQDAGLWGSTYVVGSSFTSTTLTVSGGLAGEEFAITAQSDADALALDEGLGNSVAGDSFEVSGTLDALVKTDLSVGLDTVSGADVGISTTFDLSYISLLDMTDESAIDNFFNTGNNGQNFGSLNSSNQTYNLIDPSIGFIISNDEALYSDETKTYIDDVFHLSGTASDDWIIAPLTGETVLFGAGGTNTLYGNESDNVLIVGSDEDYLFGGGGNDLAHISFDLHYQENAEQEMDDLLTGLIGEKTDLYSAISTINDRLTTEGITDSQGNTIDSISFKGIFADYQRNDFESDAIVFEGADVNTIGFDIIESDIWGGESDLIYAYAAGESLNAAGESEFLSMLLMPEFALNDLESLDAEALGIINA